MTGGQPVGGVHITYDVPPDMLDVTSPMQTYTADRVLREVANDIEANVLIPEATTENVIDLDLVTTRRTMWIPNKYAALCIEEDMSPVEVFRRVQNALVQDEVSNECKPLVDFLRAHLVGNHPSNSAIYLDSELTQPRSSTSLIRHRNKVLDSLYTPVPAVSTGAPSIQGMSMQDIKELMEVMRDGQSKEKVKQRPTSTVLSPVEKNGR